MMICRFLISPLTDRLARSDFMKKSKRCKCPVSSVSAAPAVITVCNLPKVTSFNIERCSNNIRPSCWALRAFESNGISSDFCVVFQMSTVDKAIQATMPSISIANNHLGVLLHGKTEPFTTYLPENTLRVAGFEG